ncbi:hypothetical protein EDB84DRAFT_1440741 [Lactarius hengduanensis]|nr:hypothetical protein EDB84DRAFT_1440741 [Lactarius hengduanensis]
MSSASARMLCIPLNVPIPFCYTCSLLGTFHPELDNVLYYIGTSRVCKPARVPGYGFDGYGYGARRRVRVVESRCRRRHVLVVSLSSSSSSSSESLSSLSVSTSSCCCRWQGPGSGGGGGGGGWWPSAKHCLAVVDGRAWRRWWRLVVTIDKHLVTNQRQTPPAPHTLPTTTTHNAHDNHFASPEPNVPTTGAIPTQVQMQRLRHPNNNNDLRQDSERRRGSARLHCRCNSERLDDNNDDNCSDNLNGDDAATTATTAATTATTAATTATTQRRRQRSSSRWRQRRQLQQRRRRRRRRRRHDDTADGDGDATTAEGDDDAAGLICQPANPYNPQVPIPVATGTHTRDPRTHSPTNLSEPEDSMPLDVDPFDDEDMYSVDYNDEAITIGSDSDHFISERSDVRAPQPLSAKLPTIDHFGLVGSARDSTAYRG